MKVTIKNFKQDVYEIEIEETNTVLDLKQRLEQASNNELSADSQTLIYAGIILEDSKQLKDYKIDGKKFLVVMKKKSGPAKAEKKENATNELESKNSPKPEPEPEPKAVPIPPNPTLSTESQNFSNSESLTDPVEIRNVINNIVEMGYPEEEVIRALRASFNNPDRAVEYLVNGIPVIGGGEITPQPEGTGAPDVVLSDSRTPLSFLRNDTRFQQMRRLLRDDPSLLNGVITQIGQTNPRLLQLIRENQDEFVQLLNEPDENESLDSLPDIPVITITDEERQAIERLKALGFPEELVIQAFIACDKNEQQAANFLLSQNDDD